MALDRIAYVLSKLISCPVARFVRSLFSPPVGGHENAVHEKRPARSFLFIRPPCTQHPRFPCFIIGVDPQHLSADFPPDPTPNIMLDAILVESATHCAIA